jgi:biotin transport system substrate-specific component
MQMSIGLTAVHALRERNRLAVDVSLVVLGSLLIAGMAQIRIYLPFTPVPVTGQTFAVLLIGAVLGARRGAAAVGLYLLQGAMGLPFFAGAGAGFAVLLGPTGGYLAGFLPAAYVTGWLAERGFDRSLRTALPGFLAGQVIIYACGVLWLSRFVGMDGAFAAGVWPFMLGDLWKVALAAAALPTAWKFVRG